MKSTNEIKDYIIKQFIVYEHVIKYYKQKENEDDTVSRFTCRQNELAELYAYIHGINYTDALIILYNNAIQQISKEG